VARRHAPVSQRRRMQWGNVMVRTEVEGVAAAINIGAVAIGAEFLVATTLVRCRGHYQIRFVPDAANSSQIAGLGLIIVDEQAFTAGAASVPSPTDDMDEEWVWHGLFPFAPAFGVAAADDVALVVSGEIDSKAQRKVKPGDSLVFVWDGIITAGSPTFDGIAAIRNLFML